jgi:nitrite reductase (NADH) small subunit
MEATSPLHSTSTGKTIKEWFRAAAITEFPQDGGAAVLYHGRQFAVFHFTDRAEWYATQNLCPHKMEMALSRGLIGDSDGEPKVSCPFHKKNFSLETGKCMNDDNYQIDVYPVKLSNGFVYIGIPEDF